MKEMLSDNKDAEPPAPEIKPLAERDRVIQHIQNSPKAIRIAEALPDGVGK